MTLTHIANLLPPLTSAISLQSWEDAEDIAREITRLCRLQRLGELQEIKETLESKGQPKTPPGGSRVAKIPIVGRTTRAIIYDETGHPEPWRNSLAKELNCLLAANQGFDPHRAIHSIVARVADFEQIQVKL